VAAASFEGLNDIVESVADRNVWASKTPIWRRSAETSTLDDNLAAVNLESGAHLLRLFCRLATPTPH
jgi:hypothetical protein